MKKIWIVLLLFFSFGSMVYADSVSFEIKENNGQHTLIVKDEAGQNISYDEAINKYNIAEYLYFYQDTGKIYFHKDKEISESEYQRGIADINASLKVKQYGEAGIRVHNTDEILAKIKEIYDQKLNKEYYLVYSTEEYKTIDFAHIADVLTKNYHMVPEQNLYKYAEYGIVQPLKFMPYYDESMMIIAGQKHKTNDEEIAKVEEFTNQYLLPLFKGYNDYEKIMGVYTYIKDTATYIEDTGYTNFIDGELTPYDVLLEHQMVCIGAATTAQYLFEKLGIESYIVDHVATLDIENKLYNTTHTYNIVKFNNNWYILDLTGGDALLYGQDAKLYNANDFLYGNITISPETLKAPKYRKIDFNYAALKENIATILDSEVKPEEEPSETPNTTKKTPINWSLFALGTILLIIFIIVIIFTRH